MTGGDGSLQCIGTERLTERFGPSEAMQSALNQQVVPASTVLVQ